MIYISIKDDAITVVSNEETTDYICAVETLPDDFYYYLRWGKYKANEDGIYIVDDWVDFSDKEKEELVTKNANGETWVRYATTTPISKIQAIVYLMSIGRYEDLITALEADKTGVNMILFNAANQLDRDSPLVASIGAALEFSEEDINTLFNEAAKLEI